MRILGNRVLVSRVEEEKKEGFQTVDVQDSFVNKGKVEQLGEPIDQSTVSIKYTTLDSTKRRSIEGGDTVLFAKYSPDTQEIDKDHKIISVSDILAIL